MWKWLGGCLLVCVALLAFGIWSAYRKLAPFSGTNRPESVTIAASPARVFATLANADSLPLWMAERLGISASHHGMLMPGDTLRLGLATRITMNRKPMKWTVSDVQHGQLFRLKMMGDSTSQVVATREFTLSPKGDSTVVTSAVAAPVLATMPRKSKDSIGATDVIFAGATKLMMSSLRMQAHVELGQLKAHIEGTSVR